MRNCFHIYLQKRGQSTHKYELPIRNPPALQNKKTNKTAKNQSSLEVCRKKDDFVE